MMGFWQYENRLPTTTAGFNIFSGSPTVTDTLTDPVHTWSDPDFYHDVTVWFAAHPISTLPMISIVFIVMNF